MKTRIFRVFLLVAVALTSVSCKSFWENTLSREVKITGKKIVASFKGKASKAGASEEVLLFQQEQGLGIAKKLKESGFEIANLKVLNLERAILEVKDPANFDLNELLSLKIYFDDEKNPVLVGDRIDNEKIIFRIVSPHLLEKAKDDVFNVMIKGNLPSRPVDVEVTMDYIAKVSLIK